MKALYFGEHGNPSVMQYGDLPDPEMRENSSIIRVRACALNHLDIWVRRGWKGLNLPFPHIGGSDIAGEIVESSGTDALPEGERVVVNPGLCLHQDQFTDSDRDSLSPGYRIIGEHLPGGLAELVCIPNQNLKIIPPEISFEKAASSILVGITSWRMLIKRAEIQPDETVLIVGSGGGVNSYAALLARSLGAQTIVLAGGKEKVQLAVKHLNPTHVVDYRAHEEWHKKIYELTDGRGVDIVVDNVGAATLTKSLKSARVGARIVTVGNTSGPEVTLDNRLIFGKQLSLLGSTMGSRGDFQDSTDYSWKHGLFPPIDSVEPLARGKEMMARLENGNQFGKIILRP